MFSSTNHLQRLRNLRLQQRAPIVFEPKVKYQHSQVNGKGVLVLTTRKRRLPTAEEKLEQAEAKRQKKRIIAIKHVELSRIQHEVVNMYQHGAFTDRFQFRPRQSKSIIQFIQATYPQYAKYDTAKSFFYRTIKKFKNREAVPHMDPFRERRGENKRKSKSDNPRIVVIVDEMLSE